MVCMTVCSVSDTPEFQEFQPIGGSIGARLGALQPAVTTVAQTARIRSRRTGSAWHRFLAMTLGIHVCARSSAGGVGPQRWACAAVVARELEVPDLVRIDLTQPVCRAVSDQPVVGACGTDVDGLADHVLRHLWRRDVLTRDLGAAVLDDGVVEQLLLELG